MGRRKASGDVLNLDSLLDCLTNVVGFLIIVLVLMSLGASQAVKRIREANPEAFGIRPEDIVQLEEQQQQQQDTLEKLRQEQQAKQEQLEKEKKELEVVVPPDLVVPPEMTVEEAKRLLEEERKRLEELQVKFNDRDRELARLKAQLAETPVPTAPPSKVVTIPDPRPAPSGAEPFYFLCYEDRIMPLDIEGLQKKAIQTIETMKMMLRWQPPPGPGAARSSAGGDIVYDADKLENYFKRNNIGDQFMRLEVKTNPNNDKVTLVIGPKPRVGEDEKAIMRTSSAYQNLAKTTKLKNNYARYLVSEDSFNIYLRAREIANYVKLPAGWEVVSGDPPRYNVPLPDIRVYREEKPKVAKPPPPPKPKGPPPPPQPRDLRPPLEETAVD